jgi:hypothetical protein
VKVTLLLADAAQAVGGKLYVLGGGWSIIGPNPSPMAIAVKVEVPWDQTNTKHVLRLDLLDSDGVPYVPPGQPDPLVIEGEFEVGRPTGLKAGTPIDFPLAVNIAPIEFEEDRRYEWRLTIDGKGQPDWYVAFTTRPKTGAPGTPPPDAAG